jgi:hypothetical protein
MSHLLQCNRCEKTTEVGEDNEHNPAITGWTDLSDNYDNIRKPCHLCPDCRKEFEAFMEERKKQDAR